MRPAARAAWLTFTDALEGKCAWMYADTRGLITTARGNLIDPISSALVLPWRKPDGGLAGPDEVSAEWLAVKNNRALPQAGAWAAEKVTQLRLDDAAMDDLFSAKTDEFERALNGYYPDYGRWPSDAQLGVMSMAWAMGPGFPPGYPRFSAACRAQDWYSASLECAMHDTPPPLRRNAANRLAFENAAKGVSPDALLSPAVPA